MGLRCSSRDDGGYVLVTVLLALAVISILSLTALSTAQSSLQLARQATESEQTYYIANAGMQWVLAQSRSGAVIAPGTTVHTLPVGADQSGSYTVTITDEGDGTFRVRTEATLGQSTRRVSALFLSPNSPPPAYKRLVFSNGDMELDNNTSVCGDIYANGNLTLSARTTVWNLTTSQDPTSPCASIYGTGKAMSAGAVRLIGRAEVQGGWCDATHFGTGYACDAPPVPVTMALPDFTDMKRRATHAYLLDCAGQAAGTCTQVAPGYVHTLSGSLGPYNSALYYVEGSIQISAAGANLAGVVTFASTGGVRFMGDAVPSTVACTGAAVCASAWVSQGAIVADNNVQVYGTYITTETATGFTWGNFTEVHGVILAPRVISGNHGVFYPAILQEVVLPPGLPAVTPPGSFGDWRDG